MSSASLFSPETLVKARNIGLPNSCASRPDRHLSDRAMYPRLAHQLLNLGSRPGYRVLDIMICKYTLRFMFQLRRGGHDSIGIQYSERDTR